MKKVKRFLVIAVLIYLVTFINTIDTQKNIFATQKYFKNQNEIENDIKIYFLSEVTKGYGQADCILLEKDGHFGLIDSGRIDTNSDEYRGMIVNQFLKNHGVEKLDFFLITHIQTDHIGGAEAVLNEFPVDTLYIQQFDKNLKLNETYYKNIIRKALQKSGKGNFNQPIRIVGTNLENLKKLTGWETVNLLSTFSANSNSTIEAFNENNTIFDFAGEEMHILNWSLYDENGNLIDYIYDNKADENARSLCLYFQHGNKKLLFTGDLDNYFGGEDKIAEIVGDIDFLKVAHHGYTGSNTLGYLNSIKPECAVITNDIGMATNDTINWLEENNAEYYYTTEDEKSIIVTVSNDNIEVNYQTLGKFINKEGKRFYLRNLDENETKNNWKDLIVELKNTEKEVSVSNWDDLKEAIETQEDTMVFDKENNVIDRESLKITLKQSENWLATSRIDVKPYQDVALMPEANKEISITRDENFKDSFFSDEGILTLGQENMTGKIIFDGNKEHVSADRSIINVSYGILNMYNNVFIKDNKHFNNSEVLTDVADELHFYANGSGIVFSNMAIFNMYGGTIQNNEVDNGFEISSNQINSIGHRVYACGAGVYMNDGAVFNMLGGSIIDNVALNEAKVEMANALGTAIYIRCNGAGVYSAKGTLNITDGEISRNSCINKSNILIPETGCTGQNEVSSSGGGIYATNSIVSLNNCKIDDNKNINSTKTTVDLNNRTVENTSSLTQTINNVSRGGNVYCSEGRFFVDNCEIMNGTVSRNAITEIKTSSNTTTSSNTYSTGGGIQLSEMINSDIRESKIYNNEAYDGGAIYLLNSSTNIEECKIYNNVATRRAGGIYSVGDGNELQINNSIIANNQAVKSTNGCGGAIYFNGKSKQSKMFGKNNFISNNSTYKSGGGIYVEYIPDNESIIELEDLVMQGNITTSGEAGTIFANEKAKISGIMIYEKRTIVEQILKDIQLNSEKLIVTNGNNQIKLNNNENNINLSIVVKEKKYEEITWENFNNSSLSAKYDQNTKKLVITRRWLYA